MNEYIRANINTFRELVPSKIKLYVVDKGQSADVVAAIANTRDAVVLDNAWELVTANADYNPGFAVLPIRPKLMRPAVKSFLKSLERI